MDQKLLCNDWRAKPTAQAMLAAARFKMDEFAKEIFDLWFNGKTSGVVTRGNDRWARYMRAEKRLQSQITQQLIAHAEGLRLRLNNGPSRIQDSITHSFHAEVGSSTGGFFTGYDLLHGSNKSAGDFQIIGRFTADRSGPVGSGFTVIYENLLYVFNDIFDANKKWTADLALARAAANIARCLGTGPPKDYTLRIQWQATSPIRIEAGPGMLQQFRNK
jgi:hypothetical protein